MFNDVVAQFPERPAVIERRRLNYRELHVEVAKIAAGLAHFGFRKGVRIALLLSNRWEYLAIVLACARLGVIAVPLSTRLQQPELAFLLNDCEAKGIVFDDELARLIPERSTVPSVEHMISMEGTVCDARSFADLLADYRQPQPVTMNDEDTAIILYTSGTTGRPKGALLSHLGIVHSSLTFARCLGLTHEDKAIVAVPMSHVTGLVGVSLATLCVGGAIVMMRQAYKTDTFLELASRESITYTILVPTIYTLVTMNEGLDNVDLSAWRIGCFGGAPMPETTIEKLHKKLPNLALINAYGATETTSPTTIMPISAWRDHMDSVGQVVPCGAVRVVDATGHDLPPGEPGELLIAGPMVIPGYHNRPEANASEFVDGYWRSGDIGSIDAAGFVRVFDRQKDMINRGGLKIFSAEVENVLDYHEDVLECAVVGRADPVLGERVHAFVVPYENHTVDTESIRRFCAERLSDYKVPETVTVLNRPLPRNANGKIQKHQLKSQFSAVKEK
jgi:acyl-CoA synthetase (AMP-forming)/AMP-acid ligase II